MGDKRYQVKLSSAISEFEMDAVVLKCFPVRRPLSIPSIKKKIGDVLSHSSVLCVTAGDSYIIEYMYNNTVYIKKVRNYIPGQDFDFEGHHYIHDIYEPQIPERMVTVRRIAISMANFMTGKKYDTFTHNCHMARYFVMKKYGMKSDNPRRAKRNIFFQGFVDFFSRNSSTRHLPREMSKNTMIQREQSLPVINNIDLASIPKQNDDAVTYKLTDEDISDRWKSKI